MQIVGKFRANFENFWWKFYRKIEMLFYFFGQFVTKTRDFGNNTIFLQQFFRFRGGGNFPPFALATPLVLRAWFSKKFVEKLWKNLLNNSFQITNYMKLLFPGELGYFLLPFSLFLIYPILWWSFEWGHFNYRLLRLLPTSHLLRPASERNANIIRIAFPNSNQ